MTEKYMEGKDIARHKKWFNKDYTRLTAKDYDSLTPKNQKLFDLARKSNNIIGLRKKTLFSGNRQIVAIFDSQTYENLGSRIKLLERSRIKEADKLAKHVTGKKNKTYLTDIGIHGPVPKPLPKGKIVGETVVKKNTGGSVGYTQRWKKARGKR